MKLVVMVKMAKMVISHGYAHSVEFCDYGDYDSSAKNKHLIFSNSYFESIGFTFRFCLKQRNESVSSF